MLKLFRTNSPFSVIALFLVAICVKLAWLSSPMPVVLSSGNTYVWEKLAAALNSITGSAPFGLTLIALINIVGQGMYLNRIANTCHLFATGTYIPAVVYVLLSTLIPDWNYLSAPVVANWFLLGACAGLFRLHTSGEVRKILFNTGFLISCAAIIVLPDILFLFVLFVALGLLRPFKVSEWAMVLLGLLTPLYFLITLLFLTDQLPLLAFVNGSSWQLPQWKGHYLKLWIPLGMLLMLSGFGIFFLNAYGKRMLTQTKKLWGIVIAAFFISTLTGLGNIFPGWYIWLPALLFLSLIIANIWVEEKKKWLTRILFYLLIAVIIFVGWYPLKN